MHKLIQCILRFLNNMHLIHKHGDTDWCTVKLSCYCLHITQLLCPGAAMVTISCASIWKVLCIHILVCLHSKHNTYASTLHTSINHLTVFYFSVLNDPSLLYLLVGHKCVYQIFWGVSLIFFFFPHYMLCSMLLGTQNRDCMNMSVG